MLFKNKLNEASKYDPLIWNIKECVKDLEEHADDIEEHTVQYAFDLVVNTLELIRRMEIDNPELTGMYKDDIKWIKSHLNLL